MKVPRLLPRNSASGLPAGRQGFTLAELLIVIAIVAVLLIALLINLKTQIDKANDAKRKADLKKISNAFEEYFNDSECFPPSDILDACGGYQLSPYLKEIPCDPQTHKPYFYVPTGSGLNTCQGFRICAALRYHKDPDIARLGCHPVNGCGWGAGYNYCLASGLSITPPGWASGGGQEAGEATPTITPTPFYEGTYACTPGGACNAYDDPAAHGCPRSYSNSSCQFECGDPAKRCLN